MLPRASGGLPTCLRDPRSPHPPSGSAGSAPRRANPRRHGRRLSPPVRRLHGSRRAPPLCPLARQGHSPLQSPPQPPLPWRFAHPFVDWHWIRRHYANCKSPTSKTSFSRHREINLYLPCAVPAGGNAAEWVSSRPSARGCQEAQSPAEHLGGILWTGQGQPRKGWHAVNDVQESPNHEI
jgi:hypothetical protein